MASSCWPAPEALPGCEAARVVFRFIIVLPGALVAPAGLDLAAGDRLDGADGRAVAGHDVALFASQVDTPETSEGAHFEDVDVGCLLGLIRRQRGVAGRLDLQHAQP